MTPEQFQVAVARATRYIRQDVRRIIGVEAVRHFKKSFHDEGFTDKALVKWKDVKRRTSPRKSQVGKASSKRKILTGETGDLGDSLDWTASGQGVVISSDVPYAQVHNDGLRAGRGKGFKMPKRQFVGKSEVLVNKIASIIEPELRRILTSQ